MNKDLVSFSLYKKVESRLGLPKPAVFNFHPKHLRRIEELRFDEEVGMSDLDDFSLLKNIKQLHFLAGIESPAFLKSVAQNSYKHLSQMTINNWRWENLECLSQFACLTMLILDSKAKNLVLESDVIHYLQITLSKPATKIDCQNLSALESLELLPKGLPMESLIILPTTVSSLKISGYKIDSQKSNWLESVFKSLPTFDLANVHETPERWRHFTINNFILRCSKPDRIFENIKDLDLGPLSSENLNDIPKWFPKLEKLSLIEPIDSDLKKCLKQLKSLQKLSIDLQSDSKLSMENLSAKFRFAVEARKSSLNPFAEYLFANGSWSEWNTR